MNYPTNSDFEKVISQKELDDLQARMASNSLAKNEAELLVKIAGETMDVKSLEPQGSDEMDFIEVSIWGLKEALARAYRAGQKSYK